MAILIRRELANNAGLRVQREICEGLAAESIRTVEIVRAKTPGANEEFDHNLILLSPSSAAQFCHLS